MKFYIAGPMTGLPDFNYPEFNKAADELRKQGYKVVNPAELDGGDTSMTWTYYIKRDLKELLDCQGIVLLKGWEKSRGATLEAFVAYILGLRLYKMNHNERFELYEPEEFLADLNLDLLVRG